jgi:hypothetical protein
MTNDVAPDLAALCAELTAELDEVAASADGEGVAYSRHGAVFTRVFGPALEVRLPADIAEAALRTPDTSAADEPGWVRFAPKSDEQHATDRAEAWFVTAWRHAADD